MMPRNDSENGSRRSTIAGFFANILKRGGKSDRETNPEDYAAYEFVPTAYNALGSPDLLLSGSPWVVSHSKPGTNELRIMATPNPNVLRLEMVIRDVSAGLGLPWTEVAEAFVPNNVAESSLDTRHPRTLTLLPLLETDTASGKLMANEENLAVAFVPSITREPIAGGGDTQDQALFRLSEDASGALVVTPLTYAPGTGTPVISLAAVPIAGAGAGKMLVGRKDANAHILSGFGGPTTVFQDFTASGTWDVPSGITEVTVEAWGGGGGGGGANQSVLGASNGGGGGGGAYNRAVVTVTPTDTLTVTVGGGGAGGVGNNDGTTGGTSSVADETPTTLVSAPGGVGGGGAGSSSGGSGGAGGDASSGTGDVGFDGGNGSGEAPGDRSGGGGGGAGDSAIGGNASGTTAGEGGDNGGGDGGAGISTFISSNGNPGNESGGGGGGARSQSAAGSRTGGAGARGLVRITYTTTGDDTPATDGTMHNDTNSTWGCIVSPVNAATPGASTLLIYAGTSIFTLSSTAAITDDPDLALSDLPEGGYAIGLVRIPGSDERAYWWMPFADDDTSGLSRDDGGYIFSCNLEGDEPQRLDVGLSVVSHALKWREGIVCTDSQTVIWHNGKKNNLGALGARIKAATRSISILCLAVDDDRLFAFMQERTGLSATRVWWEEYILEEDEWHMATAPVAVSANQRILPMSGTTAIYNEFSRSTGQVARRFFWYEQGETEGWRSIQALPLTVNPFYWQNTSTSEGAAYRKFASSGEVSLPVMLPAGLEGLPKVCSDIAYLGEMPATANEDSSVTITVASQAESTMNFTGGVSATFNERDRWDRHVARFSNNKDAVDRIQIKESIDQGTGTSANRTTPNGLPFKVGFYVFLDGDVKSPREVEETRYEAGQAV